MVKGLSGQEGTRAAPTPPGRRLLLRCCPRMIGFFTLRLAERG